MSGRTAAPRVASLMYHDVVPRPHFGRSGFDGPAADSYKIDAADFAAHVRAVGSATGRRAVSALSLLAPEPPDEPLLVSFDDGGVGAITHAADALEAAGWVGHFLVTTDRIGDTRFLTPAQIRDLHARGHVVGSHSCSHPVRMADLTGPELVREWVDSAARLADIMGAAVLVASVPGGYYAPAVARAAVPAGIRVLFNSEPSPRCHRVDDVLVVGRYTIRATTAATEAAALAAGALAPRLAQWTAWNARKAAKRVAGQAYLGVRRRILGS